MSYVEERLREIRGTATRKPARVIVPEEQRDDNPPAYLPWRDNRELSERFREWRKNASLTDVAEFLGVSKRTLEGVEQGRGFRYPTLLYRVMQQKDWT
jgi:DNA-binding XRE family transcriptional regulator